jgi:cytochrome c2
MAAPEPLVSKSNRRWLAWVAGGCAVMALACIGFLTFNAVYWTVRMRSGMAPGAAQLNPQQVQVDAGSLPAGNAQRGEQVFTGVAHCNACHSLEPGGQGAGPALAGIGERAASTRPGYSAEMYLLEAIVQPNAYIASGGAGAIMPAGYGNQLSEQDLADLIAFLLQQK